MTILTDTKYLDDCTFSSGTIKDEDCADIADWTTDGDTGTGVSSQLFFGGKSCFKMDVVSAGGSNLASRTLDIGSFQTNPNVVSLKLYHSVLGTLAAGDYFEIVLNATAYRLSVCWASDGLYVYDGAAWNEVGTNLVSTGVWQEWTFSWTQQVAGVVDVYLDGTLQASAVDCSDSTAGTTGTTTFRQYGTTVIGLTYIDWMKFGNAFRIAGETWLLQEGGQLTVRTDTRWHKNSPASMTGTFSTQTVTEGKLIYDGTDVRWLAITGGSGDSPIGTTVTQGAVSGYYLGFWSSLTAAPTTAISATGFIKFREVTGGTFSAGALTFGSGTGAATAAGADVVGWIEIVGDSGSTITVPRLGEHEIRGDWFYLNNTTGSVAQTLQVPTNNGGATTYCPGVWIETAPSSNTYEYWPSLDGSTNGWDKKFIGAPNGATDARQRFVKDIGSGQMQIGEDINLSCTYANAPTQASTYVGIAHTSTYTVVSNVCKVTYSTGHLLQTGHIVGVDFTSGGASALDNTFTITVLDAYTYTFSLTTADTSGNCTVRPGLTIAFTAHTLGVGDTVYCDFTSGTGVDGAYEIYAVTSANAYLVKYPVTSAVTSGNVSTYSRYIITYTAATASDFMNLTAGNRVYLDFTSGAGVDGNYTIVYPTVIPAVQASTYTWAANVVTVTFTAHGRKVGDNIYCDFTSGGGTPDGVYTIVSAAANTFTFALTGSGTAGNCNIYHASFDIIANNGTSDSGNVTTKITIGSVPVSGCKTRIPNVILREAATASRATNMVNAAIASRPEWATSSAGAIDFEYAYSSWYHNFAQPYFVKQLNTSTYNAVIISECATALDLDNMNVSMYGALDVAALTLTSNFAGGTIQNCNLQRGNAPGTSDHSISMSYCIGITFSNVTAGIIQYARSSGYPLYSAYGSNLIFNNLRVINGTVSLAVANGVTINDLDYTDCYTGDGRAYSALYAITIGAGSVDVMVDGITVGFGGTISNVSPPAGLLSVTASTNITLRNAGTYASPIPCGTFRPNAYAMALMYASGGNNYNIKLQRIYIDDYTRTGLLTTINSDKQILYESVSGGRYIYSAMAIYLQTDLGLNSVIKGMTVGANSVTGGASVYGSHFIDEFIGTTQGRYVLPMNEPTTETEDYFTMVSGTRKFNSTGGILMGTVGDQAIWEDAHYRKGHTGFQNTTPTMSGGTIGNYTIEYDLDPNDGNGFSGTWTTATGANLSAETISPVNGFKMKVRITTTTANLTAITFLRFDTTTTSAAQSTNLYPLDTVTVSATVKDISTSYNIENARVLIWAADNSNYFYNASVTITGSGTTATVAHTGHGLSSGMKVLIKGVSNDDVYNGVFAVTVVDVDSYTYTTNSSITQASASGTITSTYVVLHGLTDSNGTVAALNEFSTSQAIGGWVRKSTGSPIYQQGSITGTVSNTTGLAVTVQLVLDE